MLGGFSDGQQQGTREMGTWTCLGCGGNWKYTEFDFNFNLIHLKKKSAG